MLQLLSLQIFLCSNKEFEKKPPEGGFYIDGGSGEIEFLETLFSNSRPTVLTLLVGAF